MKQWKLHRCTLFYMGGILIDNEDHKVRNIEGLFAAGEVVEVFMERIDWGNSLAEILVFGEIERQHLIML